MAKHEKGTYGLAVIVKEEVTTPTGTSIEQYTRFDLSFESFIGNPYAYDGWVTNKALFKITPGALKGLYAISLTQDGQMLADQEMWIDTADGTWKARSTNTTEPNIFCDNIRIYFAQKVDLSDILYRLSIYTGKSGRFVYDQIGTTPARTQVVLEPRL
jgi:hypothetical protein